MKTVIAIVVAVSIFGFAVGHSTVETARVAINPHRIDMQIEQAGG